MAVEEGTTETSSKPPYEKPPSYKTAAAKEGEEGDRLLGGDGNGADKGKNGKRVTSSSVLEKALLRTSAIHQLNCTDNQITKVKGDAYLLS